MELPRHNLGQVPRRLSCNDINGGDIAHKMKLLIRSTNPRVVAIDFSGVTDLEFSALEMLTEGRRKAADA